MLDERRSDGITTAPGHVDALIEKFCRLQQSVREQTEELAQVRVALLAAADRQALDLVARARADIARTVLATRRQLRELSTRVQGIDDREAAVPDSGSRPDPVESLIAARSELLQALRQAKADLAAPAGDEAVQVEPVIDGAAQVAPTATPNASAAVREDWSDASEAAQPERLDVDARQVISAPRASTRRLRLAGVLFASFLSSGLVVLGTGWWVYRHRQISRPQHVTLSSTPSEKIAVNKPPAAPPPASVLPVPQQPVVRVEALRPTWVRVTVDGRSDAGTIVQPAEPRTFDARHEVALRVGDAGAIRVSLNGAEPMVLGREGEALTRRFVLDAPHPTEHRDRTTGSRTGESSHPTPAPETSHPTALLGSRGTEASPAASVPTATTGANNDAAAGMLKTAALQWFDGYYRQDAAVMRSVTSGGVSVSDVRGGEDRLPGGLSNVHRSLDGVNFLFTGDTAILTARMTEGANFDGRACNAVARISQTWLRSGTTWNLLEVRLLGETKLK